jgi:hypothetical protein
MLTSPMVHRTTGLERTQQPFHCAYQRRTIKGTSKVGTAAAASRRAYSPSGELACRDWAHRRRRVTLKAVSRPQTA